MDIEFDAAKDAVNITKHGMSLARAIELQDTVVVVDDRFEEKRLRLYGLIDGIPCCAAVTMRGSRFRVISLRRAHLKEYKRHAR